MSSLLSIHEFFQHRVFEIYWNYCRICQVITDSHCISQKISEIVREVRPRFFGRSGCFSFSTRRAFLPKDMSPRAVGTPRQVGAPRQNSPVASFLEKLTKKIRENKEHLVPRPFTSNNNGRKYLMFVRLLLPSLKQGKIESQFRSNILGKS